MVAQIVGFDADEPNTNRSRMEFVLISETALTGPNKCPNLFKISTTNYTTGVVSAKVDLIDCWGDYQIQVQVCKPISYP